MGHFLFTRSSYKGTNYKEQNRARKMRTELYKTSLHSCTTLKCAYNDSHKQNAREQNNNSKIGMKTKVQMVEIAQNTEFVKQTRKTYAHKMPN